MSIKDYTFKPLLVDAIVDYHSNGFRTTYSSPFRAKAGLNEHFTCEVTGGN